MKKSKIIIQIIAVLILIGGGVYYYMYSDYFNDGTKVGVTPENEKEILNTMTASSTATTSEQSLTVDQKVLDTLSVPEGEPSKISKEEMSEILKSLQK